MMKGGERESPRILTNLTIDFAIRLACLGLLGYLSFRIVAPFVTIALWSCILAVALYPLFHWLTRRLSAPLAAALVSLLGLIVVLGPVLWLGLGMTKAVVALVAQLDTPQWGIPLPPDSVKTWPIIGERLHQLWTLAATNMKLALSEAAPMMKPVGGALLGIAQSAFVGLLELVVAILVAGFLFPRGPQLVDAIGALVGRALNHRGMELVQLAGATIRNVSRGVIGIALLQAFLAGVGFLVARIPAPSVFAFAVLLLGILQVGPAILLLPIVIWSWTSMETMQALMFTAYMIPVGLLDNALRPILMARGLTTPMPVIMLGVIGGTIAYGIVGLFLGPIVLSVVWAVMTAWVHDNLPGGAGTTPRSP
jgi:predicted PurR-regulated permease PerM